MKLKIGLLLLILVFHFSFVQAQQSLQCWKVSENVEIHKIAEDAYVHVSYSDMGSFGRVGSNGLIIVSDGEAFLFDTPANEPLTEELLKWIDDSLNVKLVGFVPNHWHEDCLGGLRILQQRGVVSYANEKTAELARANNLPVPVHTFSDSLNLKVGTRTIECWYPGAAHSMDNIVAWIPSEKILFPGCMVKSLQSKSLGNTTDGDVVAYPKTIQNVKERYPKAQIVIPGHGAWGKKDLIDHTFELSVRQ